MADVTEINVKIIDLLGQVSESMTPQQIIDKLPEYSKKDVKYSIRRLREKGLIKVLPNLLDMRRVFYRLADPEDINTEANIKEKEYRTYYQYSGKSFAPSASLEEMAAATSASA